ncbi:MAG: NUDIX hydrolase [Deltaproteobacteria bacterium HGW-Deltaproteobacteria-21]|nr:MAG: NUDIX hydrolase [Deltaproteobacteria bacterium HGW-Deltaproteobacteria-21]
MSSKRSAGLLMYRIREGKPEVFLVHPGGPFWAKKDVGAWSIPKGEYGEDEDPLAGAKREFREETGMDPGEGPFIPLNPVKQKGGKLVSGWAFKGDCDPSSIQSNTFSMEWPPRSGKVASFPEVDRAAWFSIEQAKEKILKGQIGLLEQLLQILCETGIKEMTICAGEQR